MAIPALKKAHEDFINTPSNKSRLNKRSKDDYSIHLEWLDHISRLTDRLNVQYQQQNRFYLIKKERNFCATLDKLLTKIDDPAHPDPSEDIQALRKEHEEEIQLQAKAMADNIRVKNATRLAKSNSYSYLVFRNRAARTIKSITKKTSRNNEITITDPRDICEEFGLQHAQKAARVSTNHLMNRNQIPTPPQNEDPSETASHLLDKALARANTNLEKLFPKTFTTEFSPPNVPNDLWFPHKLIKDTLLDMKNTSAPGPSGRDKYFYLFLLGIFPSFVCAAVRSLILHENIDASPFSYLRKRKIIFLKKKNKPGKSVRDFRPISLLEVFYKLASKLLANKFAPFLSEITNLWNRSRRPVLHICV